ncbi:MAG: ISAs1 family transposase [Gammaproteobacteria bacterium]|nr:ISAs1 family transposase [Gammaproteobacteria bacterium]
MSNSTVFDNLVVRPVRKEEVSLWNSYMEKHHYLGLRWIAGKSLRYIGVLDGEWVALLGWGSASKNCGARERYIGWSGEKKYKRLFFIANNLRFLILPWVVQKNLASKVLSLNLKRLSSDYERVYGHPVYLAETFVDESQFQGTCYKASNWKHVGYTAGYSRSNTRYYHHGQVKAVYLYSLYKRAREILSGDLIPYDVSLLKEPRRLSTMIKFPIEKLMWRIRELIDPRSSHGKRHPLETVLSIAVCAVLCGCKGYRSIGAWAKSLSREELVRFGSSRDTPPSESAIRRLIQRVDADKFDREMGDWLLEQKLLELPNALNGRGIAIDGKTLRGSHNGAKKGVHLLSAVIHKEGVVFAQEEVDEKTNEIKHVKPLFDKVDIEGSIVTADALHTQKELANYLVKEKKADFIFTAKNNQPTLLDDIKSLDLKKTPNPKTNRMQKPSTKGTDV